MSDKKIRFMVTAAVMAALTYVATTVVRIPAPTGGYVHMGDGLVLLCGWILGPWWGGAAAGIGSMLVDLLGGYMSFVPGTLVIKFLDAMAAALIVKALGRRTYSYVLGGIAGEAIMVAGYFVYEAAALKLGMGAAAGVLANVGQGAVGLVIGSEGSGVSRLVREECDFVAALPMQGQINSLNASVAGGIILYEITRQRLGLKAK